MSPSSTRDVPASYETRRVDRREPYFHDRPLRNPPYVRRGVTLPLNLWTSDLYRINDSVRHWHSSVRPSLPAPDITPRHLFAALEKKLQQVRIDVDTATRALQTATTYFEEIEKERNSYKLLVHRNGMRYCRTKEERDGLRRSGNASRQGVKSEPPPCTSPPVWTGMSRFSSVGPSGRDSTLKTSRQSWEAYPLRNHSRRESADSPGIPSEGDSASFAVTSVAPPLPAETIYRSNKHCDTKHIRDASRPTQSPRPAPPSYGRDEIGIYHIDLMYEPSAAGRISCRACRRNPQNESGSAELTNFPCDAAWEELREHYVTVHPRACQEIARLTPDELDELRRYGIVPNNGRR